MALQYSRREFEQDLEEGEEFLTEVVATGDKIKQRIQKIMAQRGVQAEIMYIGSTNPERLTTIIDPRSPDQRYPCDFDTAIITSEEIPEEMQRSILAETFPAGETRKTYGRTERNTIVDKFPVDATIISEEEAKTAPPILYTLKHGTLDSDQVRDTRRLRLFAMRNGVYGGYTQGFKGIALEQLAAQIGDFDAILEHLNSATQTGSQLKIISPLDRKDLALKLQRDILQRTRNASGTYSNRGLLRASPYTMESWQEEHPETMTLSLGSTNTDPHECYKQSGKFIRKTLQSMRLDSDLANHALLVIPHYGTSEVLIAINSLGSRRKEFQERFRKRWDSANGQTNL